MQAKGWILLKVLFNRYQPVKPESSLKYLPEEEKKAILNQQTNSTDLQSSVLATSLINQIHYSWLIPEMEKWPKSLLKPLLSLFSEQQRLKISKALKIDVTKQLKPAPVLAQFLLDTFYRRWQPKELLPLAYLPVAPLTPLASWSKESLVELIDLLGVYDVVEEVRKVINKEQVLKLHKSLSEVQRQFLYVCLHQKEKIAASNLNLHEWQGDANQLQKTLHKRGLIRLGKAFAGQYPDLLWYVAHLLDSGRGKILMEYSKSQAPSKITPVLVQQVSSVMNFISRGHRDK